MSAEATRVRRDAARYATMPTLSDLEVERRRHYIETLLGYLDRDIRVHQDGRGVPDVDRWIDELRLAFRFDWDLHASKLRPLHARYKRMLRKHRSLNLEIRNWQRGGDFDGGVRQTDAFVWSKDLRGQPVLLVAARQGERVGVYKHPFVPSEEVCALREGSGGEAGGDSLVVRTSEPFADVFARPGPCPGCEAPLRVARLEGCWFVCSAEPEHQFRIDQVDLDFVEPERIKVTE